MAKALPGVGDVVWVPSGTSSERGEFTGGKATVSEVEEPQSKGGGGFVHVAERENWCYHWHYLEALQSKLKKQFGDAPAHFKADAPSGDDLMAGWLD